MKKKQSRNTKLSPYELKLRELNDVHGSLRITTRDNPEWKTLKSQEITIKKELIELRGEINTVGHI